MSDPCDRVAPDESDKRVLRRIAGALFAFWLALAAVIVRSCA